MTDSAGNSFKGHVVLTAIDKQQQAVAQTLEGELPAKSQEEAADLRKSTGTGNCKYTVQYEYQDGKWRMTEVKAEQTALDGGCLRESAPAWIDQLDLSK